MSTNGKGSERVQSLLRQLPGVDKLMMSPAATDLSATYGRELVVEALRARLDALRGEIVAGRQSTPMNALIVQEAREWLEALLAPTLQTVINATGVIVHTNLGRAPLSAAAMAAIAGVGAGYSTLEYDLATGERGSRFDHAADYLRRLTGAEDALIVNNNAAAVLLMLTALCEGQEVIISRSQLVEIGGGFRVPDVMAQSGALLVEVGTTNRTHLRDYEGAINPATGALLVAHHSNFKIVGFTSEPSLAELAELAHDNDLPLLYDQGSGALLDTAQYGLDKEPTVQEALASGVDVVAFSGDKLLGGPQAGILCGRKALIGRLRSNPLARALRPDKLCLAGLAATLRHFITGEAEKEVPVWRMIAMPLQEAQALAEAWAETLRAGNVAATVKDGVSTVGGGSLPGSTLPTKVVAIAHPDVDELARALRAHRPAVIARIQEGQLLLDPRTVGADHIETMLEALRRLACVTP